MASRIPPRHVQIENRNVKGFVFFSFLKYETVLRQDAIMWHYRRAEWNVKASGETNDDKHGVKQKKQKKRRKVSLIFLWTMKIYSFLSKYNPKDDHSADSKANPSKQYDVWFRTMWNWSVLHMKRHLIMLLVFRDGQPFCVWTASSMYGLDHTCGRGLYSVFIF